MRPIWLTVLLLSMSNLFMTFAWYAHLKELNQKPWVVAALASWGIAFFEYMLQVPGNRIGFSVFSVAQLKILLSHPWHWLGRGLRGVLPGELARRET